MNNHATYSNFDVIDLGPFFHPTAVLADIPPCVDCESNECICQACEGCRTGRFVPRKGGRGRRRRFCDTCRRQRALSRKRGRKQYEKSPGTVYLMTGPDGSTYVGSTTQPLSRRLAVQKSIARTSDIQSEILRRMREIGTDGWTIEPLEQFSEDDKRSLREAEQVWIDRLQPTLNVRAAVRQ